MRKTTALKEICGDPLAGPFLMGWVSVGAGLLFSVPAVTLLGAIAITVSLIAALALSLL